MRLAAAVAGLTPSVKSTVLRRKLRLLTFSAHVIPGYEWDIPLLRFFSSGIWEWDMKVGYGTEVSGAAWDMKVGWAGGG